MELLCDTNVALDLLLRRDPYMASSVQFLNMCETGDVNGYISVNSIADLYYIVRRATSSKESAYKAVETILKILKPCTVKDEDVIVAMATRGIDFEDNMMEACAVRNNFDAIITRNAKHFSELGMKVMSPEELLDRYML